jgi:hypothetical protein
VYSWRFTLNIFQNDKTPLFALNKVSEQGEPICQFANLRMPRQKKVKVPYTPPPQRTKGLRGLLVDYLKPSGE